jgi:PAS domain S-box-containing protein
MSDAGAVRNSQNESSIESQEFYRHAVECSLQGVLIHQDGIIRYANDSLVRMFEYDSAAELVGRAVWETFVVPEHRDELQARTAKLLAGEPLPAHPGWRAIGKRGGSIWVSTSASCVHWQGRPAIVSFYLDVTERIKSEKALRDSEAKFRAIFDNAVEGLFQSSRSGVFLIVNPALARIYGYDSPEQVIETFRDIGKQLYVDAGRRQEFVQLMETQGTVTGFEFEIRRKDGSTAWVSESARAVRGDDGRLLWYEGTVEDITERKRAELALRESEKKYAGLVDNIDGIVWEADAKSFQFTFVSRQAERILGYPILRWLREPSFWRDHIHADDRDDAVAYCVERTNRGVAYDFEYRMIAADGRVVWLHDFVSVEESGGSPLTIRGVMVDITARKHAEESQRATEALKSAMLEAAADGVICFDPAGRILEFNRAAVTMFGIPRSAAIGALLSELQPLESLHSRTREVVARHIEIGSMDGLNCPMEKPGQRSDGSSFPIEITIAPILGGNQARFVAYIRNLTEQKKSEEERRRLESRMLHAQKLESLGVLAGGIAHDFNNLLTSMLGYASLATMQLPKESAALPMLREIENAARRAAELTQQMLAYSGRGKFTIQSLQLDSIVQEMAKLLGTVVSKKAVIQLDLQPATIEGDATQIRQVVMNLITNASDALEGKNGVIAIRTGIRPADSKLLRSRFFPDDLPAGNYAFVEVEDNGCGMSDETLARIFDPFFTTKFTGRGLGLAAVLGIVRGHRGTIKVESKPGLGTRFEMLIPCTAAGKTAESQTFHRDNNRNSGVILVVEDDADVRRFTCRALQDAGFEVIEAADGLEGLDCYMRNRDSIFCALIDQTMPRMDGIELLRQLRVKSLDLPIVMMSGYGDTDLATQILSSARTTFVRKPFGPNDLVRTIDALLPARS